MQMQIKDADFVRLRDFMYKTFGINLAQKRTLIEGRLGSVLAKRGYTDFGPYIDDVMKDRTGKEISELVSRLTTNFTYFMREEDHYKFLCTKVFPEWKKNPNAKRSFWSAASSSGEEPYSLAMVVNDFFGTQSALYKIQASDIDEQMLDAARKGVYSADKIAKLPKGWTAKYFKKLSPTEYEVVPTIKRMVQYKNFNLNGVNSPWVTRTYDVIFCRNVMIYFDQPVREGLVRRLYDALKPGGYLIIGMSETLFNLKTGFKYVQPSVYQRPLE